MCCRDLIRNKTITMEDAMEARKLVDFPGGLELHIGVRLPRLPCGGSGPLTPRFTSGLGKLRRISRHSGCPRPQANQCKERQSSAVCQPRVTLGADTTCLGGPGLLAREEWE